MWPRKSTPGTSRNGRIDRLKSRLTDVTDGYAPFFAGFSSHGPKHQRIEAVKILTDLQFLRRMQHPLLRIIGPSSAKLLPFKKRSGSY